MQEFSQLEMLGFEFFREFARAEYCLKAVGFRETGRNAKANWRAFATEVRDIIESSQSTGVQTAVAYFLDHPPRKQIINESGLLEWDETLPDHKTDTELVLLLVCRVRNNLFHGGKFNGHYFEPQRSEELMSHGLVVLRACVAGHPNMREAYTNREDDQ